MLLDELLTWAKPHRERIRASGNLAAVNVETRLDVTARHVAASALGVLLYGSPQALAVWATGATVQTAALMMVFANGQSSIDLCASCLLRWHGQAPGPGRDHDFNELRDRIRRRRVFLSTAETAWFEAVAESTTGRELLDFRHAVVHRVVSQSAAVNLGGGGQTFTISPSTSEAGTEDATQTLQRSAQFVEARWRQFWGALGLSPHPSAEAEAQADG